MGWEAFIPLIVQYGLPFAEKMFQKWSSGTAPTQVDFDELRELAKQNASSVMAEQLVAAGIPLDSPQAKQMLALAQ